MIPFRVTFRPGLSIFEQVVYATKRAMISGQLRQGDVFPSVRALSRELKINPNTAHKIVAYLVNEGFLQAHPGIGTVVAKIPDASRKDRAELLGQEIEQLVVEAKRLGIEEAAVVESLRNHWKRLGGSEDGQGGGGRSER